MEQDGNLKAISGLLDIRAKRYLERIPLGLLQLLKKTEHATAMYQRDKVYGLLGLAWDGQTFVQAPSYAKLEDDSFKKSDEEICKAMAHSFINSTSVLDIILLGAPTRRNPALPSWCPDFLHTSIDVCHSAMADYISGAQFKRRVSLESRFWETTRQSRYSGSNARLDGGRDFLTPRGYSMGSIRGLGCVFDEEPNSGFPTTSEDPSGAEPQTLPDEEILTAICRSLCIYSGNFHHSWERVGRYSAFYALTARIIFPEEEADRVTERSVLDGWLEKNADVFIYGKKLQERLGELKGQGGFPTDAASYFEEFLKPLRPFTEELEDLLLERMRFMRLGRRDLGWAHQDARLGDEVVLLKGCSVPVILRSDNGGDKYRLVRHAYVNKGIMNGRV
jgi:hypothetical protein